MACFCLDSILVRSARNMRHVTPLKTNPPYHHLPPSSRREGGEGRSGEGMGGGGRQEEREREEGREGPPSLGSQPLNQALSHPVNLKQSWFNSSCLSAPGPKAGGRLGSSRGPSAGRGPMLEEKQSGQARRCSRGHIAHKHPFISSPPASPS